MTLRPDCPNASTTVCPAGRGTGAGAGDHLNPDVRERVRAIRMYEAGATPHGVARCLHKTTQWADELYDLWRRNGGGQVRTA